MVKLFHKTCLLFFTISCVHAFAQLDQGGFIVPNDSLKAIYPYEYTVFLPEEGFTFYSRPNGNMAGRILPKLAQNAPGGTIEIRENHKNLYTSLALVNKRPQNIDLSFYFETYDDCYYVKFDKQERGYIRILNEGFTGWISIKDIEDQNFKLIPWLNFYGANGKIITTPPNSKCALLLSPYLDSEILVEVDENHFEIQVIAYDEGLCCEGSFCKVKATQYKAHPCYGGDNSSENIIEVYEGWLQIIDEEGRPLVFHNSHGC